MPISSAHTIRPTTLLSPRNGIALAMLGCLQRRRGRWPIQRPSLRLANEGTPTCFSRTARRSIRLVAPAPIRTARRANSTVSLMVDSPQGSTYSSRNDMNAGRHHDGALPLIGSKPRGQRAKRFGGARRRQQPTGAPRTKRTRRARIGRRRTRAACCRLAPIRHGLGCLEPVLLLKRQHAADRLAGQPRRRAGSPRAIATAARQYDRDRGRAAVLRERTEEDINREREVPVGDRVDTSSNWLPETIISFFAGIKDTRSASTGMPFSTKWIGSSECRPGVRPSGS